MVLYNSECGCERGIPYIYYICIEEEILLNEIEIRKSNILVHQNIHTNTYQAQKHYIRKGLIKKY